MQEKIVLCEELSTPECSVVKLPKNVLGGNEALEFSNLIEQICSPGGKTKTLVVDCSSVVVMNSTGLGMLVSAYSKTRKRNIRFVLFKVPDKVKVLLKMTHLDSVIETTENLEAVK